MIYSIYKITNNITGKLYIGFSGNVDKRIARHYTNCNYRNQHLYKSIRKYGWDNFTKEVIYQSLDGEHCLKVMEPYFIKEYNSYNNGYNSTTGGDGSFGYKHTQETKLHLSELQKLKVGKKNSFYGKRHSKETINNNRNKNIEILTKLKGSKIHQYSISGDLIQIHNSIRSAARSIDRTHPSIVNCCKGKLTHAYGYVWRYGN